MELTDMLQDMRERRDRLAHEVRAFLDGREKSDAWTDADQRSFDDQSSELKALDDRIEELAETRKRNEDFDRKRAPFEEAVRTPRSAPGSIKSERHLTGEQKELRAFLNGETNAIDIEFTPELRESRVLSTTTTTAGGYTVPKSWHKKLYEHLEATGAMRRADSTKITVEHGGEYHVPKTTSFGTAAIVGEGTALAEADPAFGETILKDYKYGQLLKVNNELLQDNIVQLEDMFARDLGRGLGRATGNHYINGTGTNQPTGLLAVAGTAVTVATGGTGVPTMDNLIDLYHSVLPEYRENAVWFMRDTTAGYIRKIKDENLNYIWERSTQVGTPDTLLGRPVFIDPFMPAMGTPARPIAFGDPSSYWIKDVGGVRIERSTDFLFDKDQTAFRGILRTDGNLVDTTGAMKLLVGPST